MRALRNVAIIALLALAVTILPGGGNVADGLLLALSLIFSGALAMLAVRFWRENSLSRDAMTDRQRGLIYGALGVIALMVAGADELLDTGLGTIVWLALLVASVWLIFNTWREANSV
jgi:Kef-type K+ transport system membrane component KefB